MPKIPANIALLRRRKDAESPKGSTRRPRRAERRIPQKLDQGKGEKALTNRKPFPDSDPPTQSPPLATRAEVRDVFDVDPMENGPEILPEVTEKKVRRAYAPHKSRNQMLSVSVSKEEKELLQRYVKGLKSGISFSDWTRQALFRAMGRRVPSRKWDDSAT